jgi:hypothetical protein
MKHQTFCEFVAAWPAAGFSEMAAGLSDSLISFRLDGV